MTNQPTIDLFEAMYTSRSLRRLKPDPIPDDVIRKVIEAGTQAPSGANQQHSAPPDPSFENTGLLFLISPARTNAPFTLCAFGPAALTMLNPANAASDASPAARAASAAANAAA